ncbi:G protein-coupled receptor GPR1 [Nakaseomyces bracarensis]|uniref:G protein-coupled receptor GPR1 n=1 Tax=Nakaseomyces bracarensis TaxID=273131 RepID=A0ABR4NWB1_9SACH
MLNVTEVPSLKTSVRDAVEALNTTTVNLALGLPGMFSTFNGPQLYRIRVVAITASAMSIFGGIIGVYTMFAIDKRRKVFRHDLILFLIICDFVKALILMIYPAIILNNNYVYATPAFFNTLGWLTAYATEGADIAIMVFAIHFALLIFKPNWKWRNSKTGNMEGGLYRVRGYIWPLTALIPSVLASLAFINYNKLHQWTAAERASVVLDNNSYDFPFKPRIGGYKPWSAWCYLPPRPLWYKIVLSWGPRYFLIVSIIAIYIAIYLYVSSKIRKIKNQIQDFKNDKEEERNERDRQLRAQRFGTVKWLIRRYIRPFFWFFLKAFKNFFTLSIEDISDDSELSTNRSYSIYSSSSSYAYGANKTDNEDYDKYHQGLQILKYSKSQRKPAAADNKMKADTPDRRSRSPSPIRHLENPLQKLASLKKNVTIGSNGHSGKARRFSNSSDESNIDDMIENGLEKIFSEPIPDGEYHDEEIDMDNIIAQPTAFELADMNNEIPDVVIPNNITGASEKPLVSKNEIDVVKKNFQREMYQNMKRRRSQIQKNVRSIFIYPCSYLALWVFPIVADCLQYNYEEKHGPVMWVTYLDTFTRPLACIVNSLVFLYREKPWRHTWEKVETKVILDRYILKGEMSEYDMLQLRKSKLGKRGWYYRGKWLKRQCWSHQPQWWKRCLWYVYRTMIGAFKLDFDYEDNCWDNEFWDQYYSGKSVPVYRSNKKTKDSEARAFESENILTSDSSFSGSRDEPVYAPREKLQISVFWMTVHLFPMMNGVDLDEINRNLRMRYKEDDFVIPGLTYALTQKNAELPLPQKAVTHARNSSVISNQTRKSIGHDIKLNSQNKSKLDDFHLRFNSADSTENEKRKVKRQSQVSFAQNMDGYLHSNSASKNSKESSPVNGTNNTNENNDDDIDIIAFLNEPM